MAEKTYVTVTVTDKPFEPEPQSLQSPVKAAKVGYTDIFEDLRMEHGEGPGKYPVR